MENLREKALKYHAKPTPGKLSVESKKPCTTQDDLALAYTPGVAEPCREIAKDPAQAYAYTSRGNTVAIISNGTAVLGLGNIGPLAALPVMEGKAVLFKKFAGLDAWPLVLQESDPEKLIDIICALAPSFGGINLEDIKAPECFVIERTLQDRLNIPVFHDDQHGTAIISLAALENALQLTGRDLKTATIVINGAGAAGIATAELYAAAGVPLAHMILVDSHGVIYDGRQNDMNPYKTKFAASTDARTLADALQGADVFVGVSAPNVLTKKMIRAMAKQPIIFAMANPDPEILPQEALSAGAAIVATGRSDFPNQANNVLGFPGIFRGALDCRAPRITLAMKLAASAALRDLARTAIPDDVQKVLAEAYPADVAAGMFSAAKPLSPTYIIPKPFDPRVVPAVAKAVAEAYKK